MACLFGALEYTMVQNATDDLLTVDFETGETIVCTASNLREVLFADGSQFVLSANGTIFDKSKNGIIPEVLEKWYSERKLMQAAMNNYQHLVKDGMEIPPDMLDELIKDI